jgi:hypothetical protein
MNKIIQENKELWTSSYEHQRRPVTAFRLASHGNLQAAVSTDP